MASIREETIFYSSGALQIEGLYAERSGEAGAVICHPHPQLGGCMQNNVVVSMIGALLIHGYSTLRFNFRGIGRSEGFFDNGIGEQEDLKSAVKYLKFIGYGPVLLAGYSFGAWVSSKVSMSDDISDDISGLVMVSPPLAEMDFNFEHAGVDLVIAGDSDPFCPLDSLAGYSASYGFKVAVVHGADHFYFGREVELIGRLKIFLNKRIEE